MVPLPIDKLHPYQNRAINFILELQQTALWLDMGLGKTTIVLHALRYLMDTLQVHRALILAPHRVCQMVWRQEAKKWLYTADMSFSLCLGNTETRAAALRKPAMVYLINYENAVWLQQEVERGWISRGRKPPFDILVADEISRLKNTRIKQGTVRGHALRLLTPYVKRRIGLTGTPASNGLLDLFGQYLVLDDGRRLGQAFSTFQSKYFYAVDYNRRRWKPFQATAPALTDLLGDMTLSMKNEDYLNLPPITHQTLWVELPPKARKKYNDMESQFFLELDSGATVDIENQGSLVNRCLQVANGACYLAPGAPEWEQVHNAKIEALDEIVEESAGKPLLVSYQFQHDAHRIVKKYPQSVWFSSKMKEKDVLDLQENWDNGDIPILLGHPASIGHGLNLQHGSSTLAMFGMNWSRDLVSQIVARLRRQGQTSPVTVFRILAEDTMDVVQLGALREKGETEESIRDAISAYRANKEKRPGA